MEFAKVGVQSFFALGIGALAAIGLPVAIALIWKFAKKECFTTILIGAASFFLFALILEKLIQNVLLFPTQMGLPATPVSTFLNAHPVLLAFAAGLFPGVFEETGRLVAYKTVLRKRTNRETSISYGIGHGGMEAILLVGMSYATYLVFAVMINAGIFGIVVDQAAAQAPDQVNSLTALASQIASLTLADIGLGLAERVFAFLFHVGASILVFYACRDRKRFWLFPLAIVLHTVMDFIVALCSFKVLSISVWGIEGIIAAFGILTFVGAYLLLYRRDRNG